MEKCELCGSESGGREACRNRVFGDVLAREYSDPTGYGTVHLLTVDCYALQHSEDHSPRSNALHLIRLYWILFCNGDSDIGQKDKGPIPYIMEKYYRDFPFLNPPPMGKRGDITVMDLYVVRDPEEHRALTYKWAKAVWDAYGEHHIWVRGQLGKAGINVNV
jgi:hypothetical protein